MYVVGVWGAISRIFEITGAVPSPSSPPPETDDV